MNVFEKSIAKNMVLKQGNKNNCKCCAHQVKIKGYYLNLLKCQNGENLVISNKTIFIINSC